MPLATADQIQDSPKTDSVKKPKTTIKLMTTPKANGTSTPKTVKDSAAKSAKPKSKKAAKSVEEPEVVATPPEPEPTPEERRQKKEVRYSIKIADVFSNNPVERDSVPSPQTPEGVVDQRARAQGGRDEADV